MSLIKHIGKRGDTVVEVLIAIAVAATVLTASYATANRSLQAARQAQERGEALKLTEGQVEQLKNLANGPTDVFITASAFCLKGPTLKPLPVGTPTASLDADNFDDYKTAPADCQNGFYNYSIVYSDAGTDDLFTFRTRWERIGGGRDEVKILYRLHK